ncbi:MFS transporter [Aeromicrobium sp. Root236]|uniref:MFS transporter n=1 Tax=Aeromicrobium sp. Root236 TaxID=1736498 RepID=UPI0006FCD546|nr:MFS transporter [Aeromicrobium sp. Root236]KRC65695.1 MFS transporter [Aeromicrobium sp. Root236]
MTERSPRLVLVVMCVGYFLVLLDVTIVNVALPRLGADLGTSVAGLQWVVDGYAVAFASLLLTSGVVGDRLGHRRVVLAGLSVFGLASVACTVAPATPWLVGSRVAQGVGAALLLPGTLAVIAESYPVRQAQARVIGVWAGIGSLALPAGPLLGGVLVEVGGWRAIFAVNIPIVLVALVVAHRVVPAGGPRSGAPLDRAGTALGAVTLAATTLGVIEAGHGGGPLALTAAVVAVAALAGFVATELHSAHPMLPPRLWRRPAFAVANGVAGIMNLGTLGMLFLLTAYLQTVQDRSALEAGVALLPLFLPLVVLAPLSGRLTGRLGPRAPMVAGLLTAAAGLALISGWASTTTYALVLPPLLLWGVGLGILTPAVVAAAVASVDEGSSGLASGVNNTARQAGGAVGIAVYGAVAGPATRPAAFVGGMHALGLATAALFVATAAATALLIPPARGEP